MLIKLTLAMDSSKRKLELIKFSLITNLLMLLVSLKVKDFLGSLRDGVSDIYKRNPTEVTEKSDVSVLGIQQESLGLLPELVKMDISIEQKSTKKSTESEKEKEEEPKTTPLPLPILLKRTSHQWVDSHTMVSLEMIS